MKKIPNYDIFTFDPFLVSKISTVKIQKGAKIRPF